MTGNTQSQSASREIERARQMATSATSSLRSALRLLGLAARHHAELSGTEGSAPCDSFLLRCAQLWAGVREELHALDLVDSKWLDVEPPIALSAPGSTCDTVGESISDPVKAEVVG